MYVPGGGGGGGGGAPSTSSCLMWGVEVGVWNNMFHSSHLDAHTPSHLTTYTSLGANVAPNIPYHLLQA